MKIGPVEADCSMRTDKHITKLTVPFCNLTNAPELGPERKDKHSLDFYQKRKFSAPLPTDATAIIHLVLQDRRRMSCFCKLRDQL